MKPRFEPHLDAAGNLSSSRLIDLESYDASEQQFAASLELKPADRRFVVENDNDGPGGSADPTSDNVAIETSFGEQNSPTTETACTESSTTSEAPDAAPSADSQSWRSEVAAKMNRYRAEKRPRAPRYPSLQLKFDTLDCGTAARVLSATPDPIESEERPPHPTGIEAHELNGRCSAGESEAPAPTAKILEFPVPIAPPRDELAEPVWDRPRILEVPEVVPPPPALGGILIEPTEQPSRERRQGFELPLIAAPFSHRILAGAIDALIVGAAFALFAYAFFRITAVIPEIRLAASIGAGLLAVFWAGYEYLMLVHSGTTPGLQLAKLHLSRFDGTDVPLKVRRWRVLASLLSGISLGLGYAWCFLDEDQLCWHDRITHTYMAPKPESRTLGPQ